MQLERVDTLEERIGSEIRELEERTNVMTREMEKYNNMSELQDSADTTKEYLVEVNEKYKQGIQLLDGLIKKPSTKCQQTVESSSEWEELQDLKLNLRDQGQDLFELQEKHKAKTNYDRSKTECLQLMENINQCIISRSQ